MAAGPIAPTWDRGGIVLTDPAAELLTLVRRVGFDAPRPIDHRAADLVRRRFGLALPPPFAAAPAAGEERPVRLAVGIDGPAIASVKWRTYGTNYRGLLPDAFIDQRDIVPPVAFWIGRAAVPPSRRHSLAVWGRPGEVFAYCDAGPCRDDDVESAVTGEVYELYVDPSVQGRGVGRVLLAEATERLRAAGCTDLRLWTLAANTAAHAFYRQQGWEPDGTERREDLGVVVFDEIRFRWAP
ncbi:MAG TPA: GNAT family N-acetyltransferase [Acidimicrobiales bacterium]